jgi:hypothetical protein
LNAGCAFERRKPVQRRTALAKTDGLGSGDRKKIAVSPQTAAGFPRLRPWACTARWVGIFDDKIAGRLRVTLRAIARIVVRSVAQPASQTSKTGDRRHYFPLVPVCGFSGSNRIDAARGLFHISVHCSISD